MHACPNNFAAPLPHPYYLPRLICLWEELPVVLCLPQLVECQQVVVRHNTNLVLVGGVVTCVTV